MMLSERLKDKYKSLFLDKKYSELIYEIEKNTEEDERDSFLHNLLGACIALRPKVGNEEIFKAIDNYRKAYLKNTKTIHRIEGLTNFINLAVELKNNSEVYNLFLEAEKYYNEIESKIKFNPKLEESIALIYKQLLNVEKRLEKLKGIIINGNANLPIWSSYIFSNNFLYNWDQKDYFEFTKKFKEYCLKYEDGENKLKNPNFNFEKIKIGFVSADLFGAHSVTYFLQGLLENLNKNNLDLYCFSLAKKNKENKKESKLKKFFKKWINISEENISNSIKIIQKNEINILIDLMGFTGSNRVELFQNRISPVQISWLGHNNTIGLKNCDYLILDKNLVKEGEEKFYHEKIIKLNNIWNCHSGFKAIRKLNPLPYKKNNYITFCSFNNFLKISKEVVSTWSKILKSIPDSKLLLKSSTILNKKEILKKFKEYEVEKSIIIFDKTKSFSDHIIKYNEADIALDTFPYTGVTTSFEALWMNVPVLTMKGFNANSRCGESININADMKFFIAKNTDEYLKKAIYLSENIDELIQYREKLFKDVLKTPLFNVEKFTKEYENHICKIFQEKKLIQRNKLF